MKLISLHLFLALTFWCGQLASQSQYALSFDGVDDYTTLGTDATLDIKGPITIEVWVYPDVNLVSYKRFIVKQWETSYNLGVGANANSILFGMAPNGSLSNTLETGLGAVAPVTWNHVAGTWDGTTLRIFVNGVEAAQKPWINNSVAGSGNPVIIATDQNLNPLRFFDGRMDEVRIWNVARTEQEIRDNMYKELTNPDLENNLVAYYRFNEGSGQTSEDLSQNSNTAVLGGTLGVEPTDPAWVASTAPIPYYTISSGAWGNKLRWGAGQGFPANNWAIVRVDHAMTTDNNYSLGSVTINTMGAITVMNGNSMTVNDHLLILSTSGGTGSLIVNGSLSYGNAVVQRYYSGNEWHFISPPINNALSGLFAGLYLQYHDEATNNYFDIVPTNVPLIPGKGYAIWNSNNATANFSGSLNTGIVGSSGNLMRSGAGNDFGWNLVGNPFPSSIDWLASSGWTKTNINNATYIHVNSATWATYVGGIGTNGGSRYIAPGQGFFVSVNDNGGPYPEAGSLIMSKEIAIHHNAPFFKSDVTDFVRIEVSGNGYSDETVIRFLNDATLSFDNDWDGHKLFGYQQEAPQIYSVLGGKYAINSIPEPQPVTLGVKGMVNDNFTISAIETEGVEYLFLEDVLTQKITDLLSESYTFDYSVGANDERFILHFVPIAGIGNHYESNMNVFSKGHSIMIDVSEATPGDIKVFTTTGQLIHKTETKPGRTAFTVLSPGIYIVQVMTPSWSETRKVHVSQ
jgi:hypothetical protein